MVTPILVGQTTRAALCAREPGPIGAERASAAIGRPEARAYP